MSGGENVKEALLATLCRHPDAEKYQTRALLSSKQAAEMLERRRSLTKADFLTATDDEGKLFIDSAGAWENFDKITKIIQSGGEKFTHDDLMTPVAAGTQKTFLDVARLNNGLGKLFSVDVWQGRYEEMERLWYRLPVPSRKFLFKNDGLISADLKRQMYAAEGRVTPEDRLLKTGLTPFNIRQSFGDKALFEEANRKLQQAGDYMRKEYVLLADSSGDTVFDNRAAAWDKYDAVVKTMKEHGERFEVADYLRQMTYTKSILSRAAEHRALNKVFTASHWAGRLPDMLDLWSHVLEGWKTSPMTTHDFNAAYADAESLTYGKLFEGTAVTGKADLLKPLNTPGKDEQPVLPLGLKIVWDNLDLVRAQLVKQNEWLTTADLRKPSGQLGNTCLMSAAKFGYFAKVSAIAKQCGDPVTVEDFLVKDRDGYTMLAILAEKNQLAQVFAPQMWAGRVAEMKTLWSYVPAGQRKQIDFQQIETAARQETLKLKKGGIKILPGPKGQ